MALRRPRRGRGRGPVSAASSSTVGSRSRSARSRSRAARYGDDLVADVSRHPDRAGRVGDRSADRLADPPRGVGRELEAAAVVELLDRPHQADVALLDEVEDADPARLVAASDRDDEAEVRLDEASSSGVALGHRVAQLTPRRDRQPLGRVVHLVLRDPRSDDCARRASPRPPPTKVGARRSRRGSAEADRPRHHVPIRRVSLPSGARVVLSRAWISDAPCGASLSTCERTESSGSLAASHGRLAQSG